MDSVCLPAAPKRYFCGWWGRHTGAAGQNSEIFPRWGFTVLLYFKWPYAFAGKWENYVDSLHLFRTDAFPQQVGGAAHPHVNKGLTTKSFSNEQLIMSCRLKVEATCNYFIMWHPDDIKHCCNFNKSKLKELPVLILHILCTCYLQCCCAGFKVF